MAETLTPFPAPRTPETPAPSSPFEFRMQISGELEERVLQLVNALESTQRTLVALMAQPPYVVVQPYETRAMKHTPHRGPDGKIEYVIVEPA